ncbi:MAG: sulfur carrier protein ThiS [Prevotella sp.]|nr:sulfur carrier protein ThiS [Prevotella sp.]
MEIAINGKKTETSARSIQELAEELSLPERGVAIAIAQRMIPHSEWAATTLQENDSIVIIKAACGG